MGRRLWKMIKSIEVLLPTASETLQAVLRGANELNGAVAVEDERGRVVTLERMDRQVCLYALVHILCVQSEEFLGALRY